MTLIRLIIQSLRHYLKSNLWVTAGVAISTAVITGGLIVGDSVKYSLEKTVVYRLGAISQTLISEERYFTTSLSEKLNVHGISNSAALRLKGVATNEGGLLRLNNVQVWGIDQRFNKLTLNSSFPLIGLSEGVCISENLARRLNLAVGELFQLRIEKGSLIPANAPFVSDENQTISTRFKVARILSKEQLGRLNLQNSQTAPYNVFLPITELNRISGMDNRANVLLIDSDKPKSQTALEIQRNWTLEDAGFTIVEATSTNEWELRTERVFIDRSIKSMIENTGLSAQPILTYFANRFQSNQNETPYSFVSSLPDDRVAPGNVVINSWLANDLKIKVGDSLSLFYYEIGPLRELTETYKKFRITGIEPMMGYFSDRFLMPDIPGLSTAENCRDWQTGVPINLKSIRKIDEDYWYTYKGVPKAFIAYSDAEKLWGNRFGNATAYRFSQFDVSKEELETALGEQIDPFALDLELKDVKEEGFNAARNGTDFGSLFIGLSFFILVAGLLLTSLLFIFNIEKRNSEIGTLFSLGFKKELIQRIFLIEGVFAALSGAIAGIGLAVGYNELVFIGLNRIWNDIVRTDLLVSHYSLSTIMVGVFISVLVSMATIWFVIRKALKRNIVQLQRNQRPVSNILFSNLKLSISCLFGCFGLGIMIMQLFSSIRISPSYFFVGGGSLLISMLLICDLLLSDRWLKRPERLSVFLLVLRNIRESRSRSLLVIILLAIGTFLVVSTGLNRQDLFGSMHDKSSGTGGYLFWAESTVPVLHNLDDGKYKQEQGFSEDFSVVQFSVAEGDDASCLNLNRISNPRILGVESEKLQGRFSFQEYDKNVSPEQSWLGLNSDLGDCIPAIADQTVIQWSLGKKVGDTLIYKNSVGEMIKLKLIAGLSPSVFQGNVLIDQSLFLKNFPTVSGSNVFLIDGNQDSGDAIAQDLNLNFRDIGWEMTSTAERLSQFKSIENTYLSIFLAMGALGLLIGSIGLVVVLLRVLIARRSEFSLLSAVGFNQKLIVKMIIWEFLILLTVGIIIGFISAVIAVWPVVSGKIQSVSFSFVLFLIGIILINGFIWIIGISTYQLKNIKIVEALRND